MQFGYARVSTAHQHEDRQVAALLEYGIEDRHIFVDKESGKDLDRKSYQLLKGSLLRRGDTLIITSLDRLSRNKGDIRKELEYFKNEGIVLKVMDLPTTMMDLPNGQEWVFELVNNILIEVLGTIAEQERANIKKRQAEGIAIAKAKNVVFGRPAVEKPHNFEEVMALVDSGQLTSVKAMSVLGLRKTKYYQLRQAYLTGH